MTQIVNNPRETWNAQNNTNNKIVIGDMPQLPSFLPGDIHNLLRYATKEEIQLSQNFVNLVKNGRITLTKTTEGTQKPPVPTTIPSTRARIAVNSAEENETGAILYEVTTDNAVLRTNLSNDTLEETTVKIDDSNNLIFPKTIGVGIKVDSDNPTFGWRDLLGKIAYRGVGATDPNLVTYRGSIKQYQFTLNDETWSEYHIPHCYVPDSDIFIHVHWSHNSGSATGGTTTWSFDVSYSKGHDQAAFIAPITTSVVGTVNTTQYQHILSEVQLSAASPSGSQLDSNDIEPDGIILMRTYFSSNDITGAAIDPFLHFVDIHYQSTEIGTKDKAPDFYT